MKFILICVSTFLSVIGACKLCDYINRKTHFSKLPSYRFYE